MEEIDPQNTPEMRAWREKIKKDLLAAGIHLKNDFKVEPVHKKKKPCIYSTIQDTAPELEQTSDPREELNPEDINSNKEHIRGRHARKNSTPQVMSMKTMLSTQKFSSVESKETSSPSDDFPDKVVLPDQQSLINEVLKKEAPALDVEKPLPRTLQEVYQEAVVQEKTSEGYSRMDLSLVRFPAEWRIPRENRSVCIIADMRRFKEKLEDSLKMMENSSSKKKYVRYIEAYKIKLAEFKRIF